MRTKGFATLLSPSTALSLQVVAEPAVGSHANCMGCACRISFPYLSIPQTTIDLAVDALFFGVC